MRTLATVIEQILFAPYLRNAFLHIGFHCFLGSHGVDLAVEHKRRPVAGVLRQVGMEHLAETRFGQLSGGQRQRVLIASIKEWEEYMRVLFIV